MLSEELPPVRLGLPQDELLPVVLPQPQMQSSNIGYKGERGAMVIPKRQEHDPLSDSPVGATNPKAIGSRIKSHLPSGVAPHRNPDGTFDIYIEDEFSDLLDMLDHE